MPLILAKKNEKWLDDLTVSQARKYIEEGQFAAGSMLPKVQACVDFASSGTGRTAMITLLEKPKMVLWERRGHRFICKKCLGLIESPIIEI